MVGRRGDERHAGARAVTVMPREWQWTAGDAVALRPLFAAAMRERRVVTLRWVTAGAETVASGRVSRLVAGAVRLCVAGRGEQVVPLAGVWWAQLEGEGA